MPSRSPCGYCYCFCRTSGCADSIHTQSPQSPCPSRHLHSLTASPFPLRVTTAAITAVGSGFSQSGERLAQSSLHVASMGLSYLIMLAVMSMNLGVFVAVLVGFGAGFYVYNGERLIAAQPLVRSDACHGH